MASLRWSLAGILLIVGLALAHHIASSGAAPSPRGYLPLVQKGPSPTIEPTATSTVGMLQVLPTHRHFLTHPEPHRTVAHIVGEVRNLLGHDIEGVILRAFVYKDGQRVGVGYGTVPLQVVPHGAQTCFAIEAGVQGHTTLDGYTLTLVGYRAHQGTYHWLRLEDVSGEVLDGDYVLSGISHNDAGPLPERARAAGTLYDASGAIVDCKGGDLEHNDESDAQPFSLHFDQRQHYDDVASWSVQALGVP